MMKEEKARMDNNVTMYTLAEQLNVSTSSVSRAFNPNSKISEKKRKLILEAAKKANYTPNNMASRLSQTPIKIGVLVYSYMLVYDNEIIAGIKQAYQELRGFKVVCDFRVLSMKKHTFEDAFAVLDEFEKEKYDGVMISNLPEGYIRSKIDSMAQKGIPVVIFDADIPDSRRLFVSMNNIFVSSAMVAQLLNMFIPAKEKNIAVFGSVYQKQLISLFCEHAAKNDLHVAAIENLEFNDDDQSKKANFALIDRAFSNNRKINGIYVINANCLAVCEYLAEKGLKDDIVLITSDIYDAMYPYFDDGTINASIYQNPFAQGHDALEKLYFYIAENKPVDEQLLAHPQVILRSNVKLFQTVDPVQII